MKLFKKALEFKKELEFVNDRRQSKRYDIMLKLSYSYPATGCSGESFTKNISRNGMRFPVNSILTRGVLLDVKVEDPNSDRLLLLKGRVVWLEEFSRKDNSAATRYEAGIGLLKKKLF